MKKTINKQLVKHIAKLENLYLSKKLDTFDKKITNSSQTHNRFRADKIDQSKTFTQKEALNQARQSYQGYFVVKSIF